MRLSDQEIFLLIFAGLTLLSPLVFYDLGPATPIIAQVPKSLTFEFWSKDSEDIRNLIIVLGAIVGLPIIIWRTYAVNKSAKAATQSAGAAEKRAETAEATNLTDRFTRAVDQLGATHSENIPNLEVRLGGIYALEKIAQQSVDYHWQIMEILTAYVRQNTRPFLDKKPPKTDEEEQKSEGSERHRKEKPNDQLRPRIDIKAILTVISRRKRENEELTAESVIDLTGVSLIKADLSNLVLDGVNLINALLNEAHLYNAKLNKALLYGAKLNGANLFNAELNEANLGLAELNGADLRNAELNGANLYGAKLNKANRADMKGAKRNEADLRADLRGARAERGRSEAGRAKRG